VLDELIDELGLDVLRIGFRGLVPGDEQVAAVSQLPEESPTPVPHGLAGTMPPKLIESLGEASPAGGASGGLADVQDVGPANPSSSQPRHRNRRVLLSAALEN
jgi:hypothetical protein